MIAMEIEIYNENGSNYPDDIFLQDFNISQTAYSAMVTPLAAWEVAAIVVLLGLLIISTLIGNIFILVAITTHKPLRVPQNYLIASLAIADLMVAVAVMPISLVATVSQQWTFGHIVCNFWISMDVFYCTASILNLCIISLDRYWAITNPVKYSPKRTTKRMMINIGIVWAVSISISITPFLGWDTSNNSLNQNVCEISQNVYYTIFSTFGAFYIPATIVLVVYYKISVEAKKRIRQNVPKKTLPMLLFNKSSSTHTEETPDTASSALQPSPNLSSDSKLNSPTENIDQNSHRKSLDSNSPLKSPECNSPLNSNSPNKSPDLNSNSTNKFRTDNPCRKSTKSTTSEISTTSRRSEGSIDSQVSQDGNLYVKRTMARNGSLRIETPRRISAGSPRHSTSSPPPAASPSFQRSMLSFSRCGSFHSPSKRSICSQQRGSLSSIIEERQREKRALAAAREQRATRTVFIVTGAFLVCWLPFFLAALILPLCSKCYLPQLYKVIFLWLGYCNSSFNPIIYTVFNKDFKDAFKKMLHFGSYRRGIRHRSITKRPRQMSSFA